MTLRQTVDIPEDRRIFFDIPREAPTGKAQVEVRVIPFPVKKRMTEEEEIEIINRNADRLNRQAMEGWEYQKKWLFESDEGWEKE